MGIMINMHWEAFRELMFSLPTVLKCSRDYLRINLRIKR